MWIDTKAILINLDKICLIYASEDDFECNGKHATHYYIYYFPTFEDFRAWLADETSFCENEIFPNEEERDARYEELKKLLIKKPPVELF